MGKGTSPFRRLRHADTRDSSPAHGFIRARGRDGAGVYIMMRWTTRHTLNTETAMVFWSILLR